MITRDVETVKEKGKEAAQKVADQPVITWLTRMGYGVRGFLYLMVGLLAFQVAIGGYGGRLTDPMGAIQSIAQQRFGGILLVVIAIGLAGYVVWNLIRAVLDPYDRGSDTKGRFKRLGYVMNAIPYGALFFYTLRSIFGFSFRNPNEEEQVSASILTFAWGPWLVGAVGIAFLVLGFVQIVLSLKDRFEVRFDPYLLTRRQADWIRRLGRLGIIARGIVFCIIGSLITWAAITLDPEKVGGMDDALRALAQTTLGTVLLGFVALGFAAYGVYSLLGAAWFRIKST